MSRELLARLQGAQAFDPAPKQNELHSTTCHSTSSRLEKMPKHP